MSEQENILVKQPRVGLEAGLSVLLGVICGGICGAVILSFGALIGRSGSTGTEYFGYWDASLIWLGLLYGGFFGLFVAPLAYLLLVRKLGLQKAFWPALIGTLTGGLAGAIAGPPLAVVTGISGFLIGIYRARSKVATPAV
jgi:hypothetical protein